MKPNALATTPSTGIRVQLCGDAHLSNFGGFAAPDRQLIFDLNDFNETLPGPWEWDVKRLAASIEIAARSVEGTTVEVSVRDFGPGLPAHAPARIFERFFSTKKDGMGMGLAICRTIVEAHGGRLTASPGDPYGAVFRIVLPVVGNELQRTSG